MYCKKCGTEQKEGQKFCPKCGEPYFVAKDAPTQNGDEDGGEKVKDSLAAKVEELSLKGKAFIEEKVQPQIKEKVEEFKKIDWEEKRKESTKIAQSFFSDKAKMRKATIWIAIISVLWFFIFRGGFSASWYWWLFAIAFIVGAFYKLETKDEADAIKKARLTLILAAFLGVVLAYQSPNSGAFGGVDSDIDAANEGPHEVCIYNDVVIVGSRNKGYQSYDIVRNNGNYGVRETINSGGAIITDVITIPRGKKWKYERDESTAEGNFYTPMIYHYQRGDENVLTNYRTYSTRNKSNVPIFSGGDKILIFVPLSISPNETSALHLKVYFKEANDEFSN